MSRQPRESAEGARMARDSKGAGRLLLPLRSTLERGA